METRYGIHPDHFTRLDTQELRDEFLITKLMVDGEMNLTYSHYDRFIVGGAVPMATPLPLENDEDLRAEFFLERRELGILNLGDAGSVFVDGTDYSLAKFECLYVSRGSKTVTFSSKDAGRPAKFYLNSAPAHREYPTTKYSQIQANKVELGDQPSSNRRTLYQYFHEDGIQSCQLVMGFTELHTGSVWNTFPPPTPTNAVWKPTSTSTSPRSNW